MWYALMPEKQFEIVQVGISIAYICLNMQIIRLHMKMEESLLDVGLRPK